MELTHVDKTGRARMVDISSKKKTVRAATARGSVTMTPSTYDLVRKGQGPKGDVFAVAKIAGIMAAKKTAELIPLCHPIAISHVDVDFHFDDAASTVEIIATVRTTDRTGVEMEALTCAMVTGLTIYDMIKAVEKGAELGPFYLIKKSGGKSGTYERNRGK
jgi:cyclic pyranopterin monophosphate synthase